MTLRQRIAHLERDIPDARCDTCRGWPPMRVVYAEPDEAQAHPPACPPSCPSCGWSPVTFRVVYAEH